MPPGYPGANGHPGPSDYPGPHGYAARNGYPGPDGYPAPGAFAGRGVPPGLNPYAAGDSYPGQSAPPGRTPYPGPDGYPASGGYAQPGPDGDDRPVNGGQYAYVIRQEEAAAPAPASSRPDRPAPGDGPAQPGPSTAAEARETPEPAAQARAVTVLADGASPAARAASGPVLAYGPDDPGYGPPGPDWYRQTAPQAPEMAQATQVAGTAAARGTAAEPVTIRSPFEPLPRTRSAPEPDDNRDAAGQPGEPADRELDGYDMAVHASASAGNPGDPDAGRTGPGDGALSQLRNLYARAERISPEATGTEGGDRQVDELLARQRKLISDYFQESGGRDRPGYSADPPARVLPRRADLPQCAISPNAGSARFAPGSHPDRRRPRASGLSLTGVDCSGVRMAPTAGRRLADKLPAIT